MFNLIVIIIFSIIIAAFAISNSTIVSVNFIFWQTQQASLAIVILVSTLIGVIFAGILGLYQKAKDTLKIYDLERKLRESRRSEEFPPKSNN